MFIPSGPIKVLHYNPGRTGSDTNKRPAVCKFIDFKAVTDSLDEVIRSEPGNANAYFERGISKVGLKDYQGAVIDFSMTLEIIPGYAEAYCSRGLARIRLNQHDAGCQDLKKARELGHKEAFEIFQGMRKKIIVTLTF